ncbi:ketopantoate reductase PanE/ApbA-domain-containing protein [Gigaspora rosea]|uniref:Ketopantoate reductase PanE/ApbA-domain-containing protein n=1 Tax=Gigaspora rosea TaxID=44941 RepID=A0A397UUF0_9GLOM|nr:ketopantoate reductase PanE/ApbA-domain-containing protein [Gigaspora rosea]CAG8612703.1 19028_t:CDS:2 [Gigaspora rosea]
MVKLAILGCGNIGFFLAAKILHHYYPLSNKKENVVNENVELLLVGRQRLLNKLNESGEILLMTYNGTKIIIPRDHVNYVTDVKKIIEFQPDYVLVTLKVTQTVEVMREIAELDGKVIIVSIQNGVRNFDLIRSIFLKSQIISGMIVQNIIYSNHCNFTQTSNGSLFFQFTPSTHFITSILSNAGINSIITTDIRSVQYGKLLLNLGNAFAALGGSVKQILDSKTYRHIYAICQWEAIEVLDGSDINFVPFNYKLPIRLMPYILYAPDWLSNFLIANVLGMKTNNARSSMLEDFSLGRKTEIEELQGEIVRLGEIIRKDRDEGGIIMDGVKLGGGDRSLTPYNHGILELVKLVEEWMEEHKKGWDIPFTADEVLAFIEYGIVPQTLQF